LKGLGQFVDHLVFDQFAILFGDDQNPPGKASPAGGFRYEIGAFCNRHVPVVPGLLGQRESWEFSV